jgi:hypothetical protein
MANVDAKFGLRPVRTLGSENVNQNVYSIATNYATAIYTGDPVQMTGTGKNVILAEATNADNIGVFVGCSYTDANGKPTFSPYWPGVSDGKANIKAFVVSDPETIFEVQGDSVAEGDVGALCDWNAGTGSALTGLSGSYAVVSGATGTTGKSLRIMGLVDRPDNAYGAYAKIEVMFATHVLSRVVSGVGGI